MEASTGLPVTVNVLDGAYNPFPGTPLTIKSATASNGAAVQISGGSVTVTPPAGALDQFQVTFTVGDATGDADRQVTGTLTVIPLAKPEAPTAVVATSLGKPDSVDVAWQAPALTRPAIDSFTVYWSGGQAGCGADAGHCEVGPLTPGTAYTFTVAAKNSEGEGPKSLPSASITPDVEPDVPAAPVATWADKGAITVTWQPPNNKGSAIASYLLQLNTGAQKTVAAGSTSATFTGLDPTVQVNVTVAATNSTGKTSQTSAASNTLYPSDVTLAPGTPDLVAGKDAGGTRTITATWAQAQPQGDPAETYLVTVNGSTSTVTAPTTSYVIQNVQDGQQYAVSVKAHNHVGDSAASGSASLTTNPDVADVTNAVAKSPNQVDVSVKASSNAGGSVTQFQVFADGAQVGSGSGPTITVPAAKGSHTFSARACVSNGSCSVDFGETSSAIAFDSVGSATATFVENSQTAVRFNWYVPPDNGRGPMQVRYQVDGGGWSGWGGSDSGVFGNGCSQSHIIQVQGRDSAGLEGSVSQGATGSSAACPLPTIVASRGPEYTGGDGGCNPNVADCYYMNFTVSNFSGTYSFQCQNQREGRWWTESHAVSPGTTYRTQCFLGTGYGSPRLVVDGIAESNWVSPWP